MLVKSVIIIVVICFHVSGNKLGDPLLVTNQGTYRGSILHTWKGSEFYAFRGIRYAEPPIGSLRFKDPIAIKPSNSSQIVDATTNGNDCPSIYFLGTSSEDCLFLNVYTRSLPDNNSPNTSLRPVIAFVHPGGFYVGSSSSMYIGPEYLLEKDIVLVTFNYRLASLGFLNLGTEDYPGNAGLKDQVFALRWIQENIKSFGGDMNAVSLMGYSAGGASVSLHLVSPMSHGLFQKAIIMSGSIPPQTIIPKDQKFLALRQAKVLGCNSITIQQVLKCLEQFDGRQIALTLRQMFDFGKDNPIFLWLPIVETDYGQERFLIEDPFKSFRNGDFHRVPILTGFTENESCTSAAQILGNLTLLNKLNDNFTEVAIQCFMLDGSQQNYSQFLHALRLHYFNGEQIDSGKFTQLCKIFSDSITKFGSYRIAKLCSDHVDVFTYLFSFAGRFSNFYYPGPTDVYGAEHMDDLMYIFKMAEIATFKPTDPEATVIELLTEMLTSFSKTGNPSTNSQILGQHAWKSGITNFAKITNKIEIFEGNNFPNYQFWDDHF